MEIEGVGTSRKGKDSHISTSIRPTYITVSRATAIQSELVDEMNPNQPLARTITDLSKRRGGIEAPPLESVRNTCSRGGNIWDFESNAQFTQKPALILIVLVQILWTNHIIRSKWHHYFRRRVAKIDTYRHCTHIWMVPQSSTLCLF